MSFHFIHTADLQIGKKFGNFPDEVALTLQNARLEVVKKIAELATKLNVDAILVAGDCFETISVSDKTLRRFKLMTKNFNGTWVLLPGNHDYAAAESPWSRLRELELPDNIFIVDKPKPLLIDSKAVILPAPLQRRQEVADLTEWFDTHDTDRSLIRVGLAHGSVENILPKSSNIANPIAPDRCEQARLDYLALGDWHGHKKISEKMWYAGTPEPDRFPANEPGYILDVKIDHAGALPQVDPVPIAKYRWETKNIEILQGNEISKIFNDKNLDCTVLKLKLSGTVSLATLESIKNDCEDLGVSVLHLELIDELLIEPSSSDLDGLDTSGFVGIAFDKLKAMQSDQAKRALSLLYSLYHQNKGGA